MERLTEREFDFTSNFVKRGIDSWSIAQALKKLQAYEDLEEQCIAENQCDLRMLLLKWKEFFDDIAELYDYRKAEEQGFLLRLPCKVGDTVFLVQCGKVYERKVSGFSITSNNRFVVHVPDCEMDNATLPVEWFGKRAIFSTREEAESALAEKGE